MLNVNNMLNLKCKIKTIRHLLIITTILALISTLIFTSFTGCSSKSEKSSYTTESSSQSAGANYNRVNNIAAEYDLADMAQYTGTKNKEDIRKIIKTGEIAIEVKDVKSAYSKVTEILKDVKGEEFSKYFTVSGEYKRMELVLKIPPKNLELFEQKLTDYVGEGKIKRSQIRSQDITSQYYDYVARLESYTASRDQLRELMKKAETVEDTLKIHSELTRIQAEIDSLQGQINMWDKLVEMSTITLYIDEESNPMKATKTVEWQFNSPQEIWTTMKNGFITVVNGLYSVIVWILILIVSLSPVLAIAAVVIYVIRYSKKKGKESNKSNIKDER